MVPDAIKDQWDGPAWRWWALGSGIALVAVTIGASGALAAIVGGDARSLAMLGLLIELFVAGMIGSGMLEGLSSRAIAGGMARQPLPDQRSSGRTRPLSEPDRLRRDRITLRAGMLALPPLLTFLALLFW